MVRWFIFYKHCWDPALLSREEQRPMFYEPVSGTQEKLLWVGTAHAQKPLGKAIPWLNRALHSLPTAKRPGNAREIYAIGLLKTEVATASTSNVGESEWSPNFETTPPSPRAVGDFGEPGLPWESFRVVNLTLSPLRKETNSYLPCVFSIQNLRMIDLFLPTALKVLPSVPTWGFPDRSADP